MNIVNRDVHQALRQAGIRSGDLIYVHGDASVAAQYKIGDPSTILALIFESISGYLGEQGTLVVPAFTYSATKGEVFDPAETPSAVGRFSEEFRRLPGAVRSSHPIFSIASIGFESSCVDDFSNSDCFGRDTFFDFLHQRKAFIVTLGFLMRKGVTFCHYVEQINNVDYRYFKSFEALVKRNGSLSKHKIKYFVRDLDINSKIDLTYFVRRAYKTGIYNEIPLGRLPLCAVRADKFFELASDIIREVPYGLTREGARLNCV